MTATLPEGVRTTLPREAPPERTRPETEAAALLQRAVEEAESEMKQARAARLAADVKLERAIERRRDALRALACIGIEPTLDAVGIISADEGAE